MTEHEMMSLLKIDLGIIGTAYDPQLGQLIAAAKDMIAREGVALTYSIEDAQLVILYAAYLFRKRATNERMPRMLRWALNNRIFSRGDGGNAP